jgi:membrane associated rhomboid family serine protease
MIPYKDDNPTATFPFVTIAIIAVNVLVFIYQLAHISEARQLVESYGAIPRYLLTFRTAQPIHPLASVVTSMFMHGGVLHVGGNMLFLWIFGNNIEDTLGHFKFVVFYLLSGLSAVYAHAFTEPGSVAPMIGASGAVSGVLAAYMVLYPRARVYTIILLGFFVQVVKVPALMYIGIWAIIQIVNGLYLRGMQGAGVAWFAHVGGFLFGLAAIKLFRPKRRGG